MADEQSLAVESSQVSRPERPARVSIGAGMVLVLGVWIGLIAGYVDLIFLLINKNVFYRDFYRLGSDFPWLIPLGVTIVVLIPTLLLALIAKILGSIRLSVPLGLLSLLGFLDFCARIRLENWATAIVCAAMVIQLLRVVRRRGPAFLRFVRRSVIWLVVLLLAIAGTTVGGRVWAEYRQLASLPPAKPGSQNVVLIVWDTVRASNTSLHGYHRDTTPNLKQLASQGVAFDLAFSTSSWTLPAHASLFTGRWPHELGVDWKAPMRADAPTLAEQLSSHGYDTAGFVGNLDYCSRETGLARGFAHYEDFPVEAFDTFTRYIALGRRLEASLWTSLIDEFVEKHTGRWYNLIPRSREHIKSAASINGAFMGWLRKRSRQDRPFFAFLNYNDAHSPYEVPPTSKPGFGLRPKSSSQRQTLHGFTSIDKHSLSREDVRMANDVYDDSILYLDQQLGNLIEELKRAGALEDTLIIVTSDHGEHLGDHQLFFHGCSLYRQLVQVPLVIMGTKGLPSGTRVTEPVSLADIPATIFDLLGLEADPPFYGRSAANDWRPQNQEGMRVVRPPLLMETTKPELLTNEGREPAAKGPLKSVVAAGMHYIQVADGTEELYNLKTDVEEKTNLTRDPAVLPVLIQFRNLLPMLLKKR